MKLTPEQYDALERRIDKAVTEILVEVRTDMAPVHIAVIVDSITQSDGTPARNLAVYDPDRPWWEIIGLFDGATRLVEEMS